LKFKWIFENKRDSEGQIIKYKARLVAKGYTQVYGESYMETYSPTPARESLRMLLGLAALYNLKTFRGDVKTAFLNGVIEEDVYVDWIDGLREVPNGYCYKLIKALYGTKQASRQWNIALDEVMKKLGYVPCKYEDRCAYVNWTGESSFVMIVVYVDDVFGAGNDAVEEARFKAEFSRYFTYKDLGVITEMLGMKVQRQANGEIHVSNKRYVDDLLLAFHMENCASVATPGDCNVKLSRAMEPDDGEEDLVMQKKYRECVGSLMYLMTSVRPDISTAVCELGRFLNNPGRLHYAAAMRVLKYLKGTPDLGMVYHSANLPAGAPFRPILDAYADSNWAESDDRISTSGVVIKLIDESMDGLNVMGNIITYRSKRQDCISVSTTEAEYVAACFCALILVWLRRLLAQLGFQQFGPTILHEDNTGCIIMASDEIINQRSRHIDIKYHKIREIIKEGKVEMWYLPTRLMIADMLTKNLPKPLFRRHCENIGMMSGPDWWAKGLEVD
jgi:hypothetical protein